MWTFCSCDPIETYGCSKIGLLNASLTIDNLVRVLRKKLSAPCMTISVCPDGDESSALLFTILHFALPKYQTHLRIYFSPLSAQSGR